MAPSRLESSGTQTSRNVLLPPQVQRASLKKSSRYTRDHAATTDAGGAPVTKRVERQSSRRLNYGAAADAAIPPSVSVRTRKTSYEIGTPANRTSNGRNFTVGNIGNGGRMYLRPVVRPGNERLQHTSSQPPFAFPLDTPPDSAGEDNTVSRRPSSSLEKESLFSASYVPPQKMVRSRSHRQKKASQEEFDLLRHGSSSRPAKHSRSHSFSTVDEHSRPTVDQPGTFKVVIHRPSISKPRDESPAPPLPLLEVPIPSYRLGTPQFGVGGRAILRSSLYTRSSDRVDPRSSNASNAGYDRLLRTPSAVRSSYVSRRHSEAYASPLFKRQLTAEHLDPRASLPSPSEARHSIIVVASHLYDFLCARPDDPTVVRYAPGSSTIIAATPSRLVAHITSPSFLDYELLSDFFLTFRSFLQPDELVSFLVSRLRWAVDRPDDFGRIVRVRTFVALRHWILNYFVDDFLADVDLRNHFCDLVNGVYEYLKTRTGGGAGDIKIIGELKKCWRRTIGLYWDNQDPFAQDTIDDEIQAGGDLDAITSEGSSSLRALTPTPNDIKEAQNKSSIRTPNTPPMVRPRPSRPLIVNDSQHAPKPSITSVPTSVPYSGRTGRTEQTIFNELASDTSPKVLSCSIPVKSTYKMGTDVPLYPHPIPAQAPAISSSNGPSVARIHPAYKPTASLSDRARDSHQPSEISKGSSSDVEVPSMYIVPGSIVRGVLYQPDSPYFDLQPPSSIVSTRVPPAVEVDESVASTIKTGQPSPGMKKFFGSVKKALGHRHGANVEFLSSERSSSPYDPSLNRTTNSTPDTVHRAPIIKKSAQRLRPQVRIDLLAARVAESYREAADAILDREQELAVDDQMDQPEGGIAHRYLGPGKSLDGGVTVGSRSIVIVDDTQPDLPLMSGALRPLSHAIEPADMARTSRDNIDLQDRATLASIDGVVLGQPAASLGASSTPSVYVPTGLKSGSTAKAGQGRAKSSHMNRASASSRASTLRRIASYHSGDAASTHPESGKSVRRLSVDSDEFVLGKPPARQLRRRPGGDLKAVDKVHDLDQQHRHRRNSTGSSIIDSIALPSRHISVKSKANATKNEATPKRRRKATETDENGTPVRRKSISLIQTHSSQPNLRPSFEAEVAKLAALPDDENDDGGIESALLKLEGKYEKKTPTASPVKDSFPPQTPIRSPVTEKVSVLLETPESRRHRHHKEHVENIHPEHPLPPLAVQTANIHHVSQSSAALSPVAKHHAALSVAATEDSYSSIPLLQRGVSSVVPRDAPSTKAITTQSETTSPSKSGMTEGQRLAVQADAAFNQSLVHESFLLDDDGSEALYDPYDLSAKSDTGSQEIRDFIGQGRPSQGHLDTDLAHALRHDPYTVQPPADFDTTFNQGLPTPGMTPLPKHHKLPISPVSPLNPVELKPSMTEMMLRTTGQAGGGSMSSQAHLPFILAYDAEVLAQQLTILEKDALDEIDWRELIELRWTQASPAVHDWVEYLKNEDPRGVDLVIARFNLVVKWLLSEIVLTEVQDERVRCIVQYIHIAEHCRRIRNFASMYQITIALLSAECTRLKKTWELVPSAEMHIFKGLEKIVQPVRNFQSLRREMEVGSNDEGCIPFIGIYTRDLVYNSQKPAVIETPPLNANEPLVNFERQQTAASIVKSLLRLLEASSKYNFQIEPHVVSKCLWLSALPDEEISRRSRKLE